MGPVARPARALAAALVVVMLQAGTTSPPAALASQAPGCRRGEAPAFKFGLAQLKARLGPTMGEPIECEHEDPATGDAHQATTTGLAYYRFRTNTPSFVLADGATHWALTPQGVVSWTGEALDPPHPDGTPAQVAGGPAVDNLCRTRSVLPLFELPAGRGATFAGGPGQIGTVPCDGVEVLGRVEPSRRSVDGISGPEASPLLWYPGRRPAHLLRGPRSGARRVGVDQGGAERGRGDPRPRRPAPGRRPGPQPRPRGLRA
jgi:hypothetical protein